MLWKAVAKVSCSPVGKSPNTPTQEAHRSMKLINEPHGTTLEETSSDLL